MGFGTSRSFAERQSFYCAGKNAFGFLPLNLSASGGLRRVDKALYNMLFNRIIPIPGRVISISQGDETLCFFTICEKHTLLSPPGQM